MRIRTTVQLLGALAGFSLLLQSSAIAAGHKKQGELVAFKVSEGPTIKAINKSLTGKKGDPVKGENLIAARKKGNCFACHEIGKLAAKASSNPKKYSDMGQIGPRLDGVASRYTQGELRMLLVNATKIFPETVMPAFYEKKSLHRVKKNFRGKTVLKAQEVEDILAYLTTELKEPQRTAKASPSNRPANAPAGQKKLGYTISEGPSIKAINTSLTATRGDAEIGESLVTQRKKGNCFACHEFAALQVKAIKNPKKYADMGRIGPRLDGVGTRYTKGELRMLLVDATQVFPETLMPAFYRKEGLHRVKKNFRGKTILSPQDIENILAFLVTFDVGQKSGKGGIQAQTRPDTSDPALGDSDK